jgi:hypothetical protein
MNNTNHTTDMSQRILSALEGDKVTPRPKWHFFMQEGGVWVLGAAATLCGAIAVSATLFVLVTAPLRFQAATHESVIQFWADFLPVLWIIMFVMFIFVTDLVIKRTKRGYRYNIVLLTVTSATLSILLGYAGFLVGLGEFLEGRVGPSIPFHTPVHMNTQRVFHRPDKGLLVGTIVPGEQTRLKSANGLVWNLDTTQIPELQRQFLNESSVVSLIGTTTGSQVFTVCMVIPLNKKDVTADFYSFERNEDMLRTNTCKGVRPYERLQAKLMMSYENQ